MSTPNDPSPPSRLSRHLALLDLSDAPLPEAMLAAERRAMADIVPKKLTFPRLAGRGFWVALQPWSVAAMVAACVALVFFWPRPSNDRWQTMGGDSAQVYVKVNDTVEPWVANTTYPPGTRFQAQITAGEPAIGFLAVVNRNHELLSDLPQIWGTRMTLSAQSQVVFPGSLQLDEQNQGEALVLVICPQTTTNSLTQDQVMAGIEALATGSAPAPPLATCHPFRFQLRP